MVSSFIKDLAPKEGILAPYIQDGITQACLQSNQSNRCSTAMRLEQVALLALAESVMSFGKCVGQGFRFTGNFLGIGPRHNLLEAFLDVVRNVSLVFISCISGGICFTYNPRLLADRPKPQSEPSPSEVTRLLRGLLNTSARELENLEQLRSDAEAKGVLPGFFDYIHDVHSQEHRRDFLTPESREETEKMIKRDLIGQSSFHFQEGGSFKYKSKFSPGSEGQKREQKRLFKGIFETVKASVQESEAATWEILSTFHQGAKFEMLCQAQNLFKPDQETYIIKISPQNLKKGYEIHIQNCEDEVHIHHTEKYEVYDRTRSITTSTFLGISRYVWHKDPDRRGFFFKFERAEEVATER